MREWHMLCGGSTVPPLKVVILGSCTLVLLGQQTPQSWPLVLLAGFYSRLLCNVAFDTSLWLAKTELWRCCDMDHIFGSHREADSLNQIFLSVVQWQGKKKRFLFIQKEYVICICCKFYKSLKKSSISFTYSSLMWDCLFSFPPIFPFGFLSKYTHKEF